MATTGDIGEEDSPRKADDVNMLTESGQDVVRRDMCDVTLPTGNAQDVTCEVIRDAICQPSVLEGNSNITADSEREDYVPTPALQEAEDILQNTGYVILCGPPGSGKTTMANALSRRSREQGFSLYNLEGLELWKPNVGQHERSIVVLDGILGHVFVYTQQFICWRNILKTVLEQIKLGMCRLVITVYPHVLRQLQQMENHLHSPLKSNSDVVHLTDVVPPQVKEKLLNFHLNRVSVETDRKSEIVKDILEKDVSGPVFPWCCGYMAKNWSLSEDPTAIFTVPAEAYTELLKDMVLDKTQESILAAVLVLAMRRVSYFLYDPSEALPHLKELGFESHSNDTLAAYADLLRGSILSGSTFTSRVLYEATGLAVGRYFRFATLLKVCDVPFLVKYVHLTAKEQDVPEGQPFNACVTVGSVPTCSDDPELCTKDLQAFVERIYRDIVQGDLQHICQHPCLQCPEFLQELENHCAQEGKRISQIMNAVDPVHKLPSAYWSLFLPSDVLTYWCLSKMPTNTKLSSLLLMAWSLFAHTTQKTVIRLKDLAHNMNTAEHFKCLECVTDFPLLGKGQCLTSQTHYQLKAITETHSGEGRLLYLCDPSLPIPPDIVTLQMTSDRYKLQVKDPDHWYLVFRLLTDREVGETDQDGNSLLHVAVSCGQSTAARLCLTAGAVITQRNRQGVSVYQLAHETHQWHSDFRTRTNIDEIFKHFVDMDKVEVQLLLLEGLSVNENHHLKNTGLRMACCKGCGDIVDICIELGADVTCTTGDGHTSLHFACLCPSHTASADITRALLQAGADVNSECDNGDTPLLYAAVNGYSDSAEQLICHGADVSRGNEQGGTPLLYTARYGHSDTAELLIRHGADVNTENEQGVTPLLCAAGYGHSVTAKLLIRHGADVNTNNKQGGTPLLYAARNGHSDTAELLVHHAADINKGDENGATPLLYAFRNGLIDIAELLISQGADVSTVDERGKPLLLCAAKNGHTDTAKLLIRHGADINAQDEKGKTPLLHAAKNGYSDTAQLLICLGADVNTGDRKGKTPLFYDFRNGNTDTTELLIRHGADSNTKAENCETPLLCAAKNGHTDTAELLIHHGADVNTLDKKGDSPLCYAAMKNHFNTAELLIRHGADVNTQGEKGETPLLYAACNGHSATADLLLHHGAHVNTQDKKGYTPLLYAVMNGHTDTAELLIGHCADVNFCSSVRFYVTLSWPGDHLRTNPSTALQWACGNGMVRMVQLLLQHQADVTITTWDRHTALHFACLCPSHNDSANITHLLLQAGAEVNTQNTWCDTLLLDAASNGHTDTAELLLRDGADVSTENKEGDTPLLCAARNGHPHTADLLIRHGADVNTQNTMAETPLLYAAWNGHSDTVELLMRHGADVNKQNIMGDTSLLCAARKGHSSTAEVLIRHGVDVNMEDKNGDTPLMCAAKKGHSDMAELLIHHGADVNAQSERGETPLLCAACHGHSDIADVLARQGADVNAQDEKGYTPLMYSIMNGHTDTAELLIHHCADVNFCNSASLYLTFSVPDDHTGTKPSTALHWACQNGMVRTVQLLIQHQADVTVTTEDGLTALHFACLCPSHTASADITHLLLEAGADVNMQDKEGNTPLPGAAMNGHSDTTERLVHHGADVNSQNKEGNTPLMYAARNNHLGTVERLVSCGADVNAQNRHGDTPLLLAARHGHSGVNKRLLRHGADVSIQNSSGDTPLAFFKLQPSDILMMRVLRS